MSCLADGGVAPGELARSVALRRRRSDRASMLSRDADARQIDAAIRAVAAGYRARPRLPESGFAAINEPDGHALLTPRELDVLTALAEGLTNKAIARRLAISLHTVKFHLESLFRNLGARTRTEAVRRPPIAVAWRRSICSRSRFKPRRLARPQSLTSIEFASHQSRSAWLVALSSNACHARARVVASARP